MANAKSVEPQPQAGQPAAAQTSAAPSPAEKSAGMKLLIAMGVLFIGLPLAFVLFGLCLTSKLEVERRIFIAAPPATVHKFTSDLAEWPNWTTWNTENYPHLSMDISVPSVGEGAEMQWEDPRQGKGNVVITESKPASGVKYELNFDGSEGPLLGNIVYAAADGGTDVRWIARGELGDGLFSGYMGIFFESLIGGQFDAGLVNLKELAEAEATGEVDP